ncbi:TolC family protein [Massilia sp. NP310]|nr:TolC family protein [Massilia sp. NP310]
MHKYIQGPCASSRGRSLNSSVRRARCHGTETNTRVLRLLISLCLASTLSVASAADSPSFGDLLRQAQASAPLLLEQAANVRAAAADVRQSQTWLNPTLTATAEDLGAPKQGGSSQRQDTYTVTQVFEVGGKRNARVTAERKKAMTAGARERQARVAYAAELAIVYATAEAMQRRKEVADAEAARAEDDLRAAQALVKAGREAQLRLVQAQASLAAAQSDVLAASAASTSALARLTALVGATEPLTRITHPLLSATAPTPASAWNAADTPALATAVAEREALTAQVRIEEKRWLPDIGVSLGMRRYGWTDEKAATVGLSATIPLFDRNKAGINAARERVEGASQRVEAARLEAIATHGSATAQVLASDMRVRALEQGELAATEAYRLGRLAYDAGKASLLELLAIRRALAESQQRTIEARLERIRAIATLSTAEGRIAFGDTQ